MAKPERRQSMKIPWIFFLSMICLNLFLRPCLAEELTSPPASEVSDSISPSNETAEPAAELEPSEPSKPEESNPPASEVPTAASPLDETIKAAVETEPSEPSRFEEPEKAIADPLESLNRLSFKVNDKVYFWVLKPVVTVYNAILHQDVRIGVRNFFSNLTTPVRMANCLLQAKFKGAGKEVIRFLLNSTFGMAGFLDPAKKEFKIEKTEADFGQTLGIWGLGPAFYINWVFLGPSNFRDTIGFAGDLFLDPRTYLFRNPIFYLVRPVEIVNDTSFKIGEYEELKKSAIDPYIAVREAYTQYRQNKINKK